MICFCLCSLFCFRNVSYFSICFVFYLSGFVMVSVYDGSETVWDMFCFVFCFVFVVLFWFYFIFWFQMFCFNFVDLTSYFCFILRLIFVILFSFCFVFFSIGFLFVIIYFRLFCFRFYYPSVLFSADMVCMSWLWSMSDLLCVSLFCFDRRDLLLIWLFLFHVCFVLSNVFSIFHFVF